MKAVVLTKYGSPDDLELKEVPRPTPKDGEVLIRVRATSINDWDWGLVRGRPFYIRLLCGLLKPKITIAGVDVAGQVEAVGKEVTSFAEGDEVYGDLSECGFGAFAEFVCAPEEALVRKPAGMPYLEAAAMPHAAILALQGLRDVGQLQPGQKLLINGAGGGVGTLGVQIAQSLGVVGITGVDSADKHDIMRAIGFQHVIDYRREDFTTSGQRYDLILDTKTNRSVFAYARALSPNGRYVTVGGTTLRLLGALLLGPIVRWRSKKNIRIVALKPNKGLDTINELFEAGELKPVIDGPYSLEDVPQAIRHFGEGKHKGKVVIAIDRGKEA